MSLQQRLTDLATAIGTDIKLLRTYVTGSSTGDLSGLSTTAKTSLISAINEVNSNVTASSTPVASTTVAGKVRLATDSEVLAMSANDCVVRPGSLGAIANVANGFLKLDSGTKVPAALLPSYVDDVLEFANFASLPATGATGIMYVTINDNKLYRWGGSAYVNIPTSPGSTDSVPEGSVNLYYTQARADARADARITTLVGVVETDLVALYNTAKA